MKKIIIRSIIAMVLSISYGVFFALETETLKAENVIIQDSENVEYTGENMEEGESGVTIIESGVSGKISWKIDIAGKLTINGDGDYALDGWYVSPAINGTVQVPKWCEYAEDIKTVDIEVKNLTTMKHMFYNCARITKIDFNNLDTSNVTDMSGMFYDCQSLEKLDISNWNTNNVLDMSKMFYDCYRLKQLDVKTFNTSKVINMAQMFQGCMQIGAIDVSGFNTENVQDMRNMFCSCSSLTYLDISSFNIDKVMDMRNIIKYDNRLQKITVPKRIRDRIVLPDEKGYEWKDEKNTVCIMIIQGLPVSMQYTRYQIDTSNTPSIDIPISLGVKVASYNGDTFYRGNDGKMRCYDKSGKLVTNAFRFDGTYTYYMQADGTSMIDCLTYHPDGEHIIYFDQNGHEVFGNFVYCSSVGYICYFDSQGYLYKDKITFIGDKTYYLNGNGALEQNGWFKFANGLDYGFANGDGTLMTGGFSYDIYGRVVFYHWNGMVARGLIYDGEYYYNMDETDGHYLGQFAVQ